MGHNRSGHTRNGRAASIELKREQQEIAHAAQVKFARKVIEDAPKCEPCEVAMRGWKPEDLNFIIDSWASSYRFSPEVERTDKEVYKVEQRSRIYRLIPRSRIIVAARLGRPDEILGWICFEPPKTPNQLPILHYVLVQRAVQLQGIGSALVALCRKTAHEPDAPLWSTHHTQPMRHLRDKWQVMHNDFLLEQDQPAKKEQVHGSY